MVVETLGASAGWATWAAMAFNSQQEGCCRLLLAEASESDFGMAVGVVAGLRDGRSLLEFRPVA